MVGLERRRAGSGQLVVDSSPLLGHPERLLATTYVAVCDAKIVEGPSEVRKERCGAGLGQRAEHPGPLFIRPDRLIASPKSRVHVAEVVDRASKVREECGGAGLGQCAVDASGLLGRLERFLAATKIAVPGTEDAEGPRDFGLKPFRVLSPQPPVDRCRDLTSLEGFLQPSQLLVAHADMHKRRSAIWVGVPVLLIEQSSIPTNRCPKVSRCFFEIVLQMMHVAEGVVVFRDPLVALQQGRAQALHLRLQA